MRLRSLLAASFVVAACAARPLRVDAWTRRALLVRGGEGGMSLSVTLRGKKYDVAGAESVADVQRSIEEQAGLSAAQQAVLYDGKMLSADAKLADVGLSDGDVVNVVPMKPKKAAEASADAAGGALGPAASAVSKDPSDLFGGGVGGDAGGAAAGGGADLSSALSSALGMPDMSKLGDMDMGAMGEQYEKMMEQMMDSPMIDELLNDPEKIEQSRQLILQNPMMVNMFKSVPGLEDVVNDKEKWAQQMKEVFTAQRDAYRAKKDASKAGTP